MSFDKLLQKIVSKLGNLHESTATSPGGLSNVQQTNDASGSIGLTKSQVEVLKLYDKARTNHLNKNFGKARAGYQKLMKNKQLSSTGDAAKFFFGVTYFSQNRYKDAEKYFKSAIIKQKNDFWVNSELSFLAESLIAQGKIDEAKYWLRKATSRGAQARLKNLDDSLSHGLKAPFVSY